jgi:hypothetical protein
MSNANKPPAYDPLLDPNLRQYFSSPQVQKQLLRGGMIDESGRILSDVPGAGSKVHVINSELRRYEKDAAILAKEEADLRRRVRELRLQKFVEEQQARRYALLKEEENIRLEITKMLRESQQGPPPPILGRPGVKEMQVQPEAVRDVLARNPEGIVSFYKEVSLIEGELLASSQGSHSSSIINYNNNDGSIHETAEQQQHQQQHQQQQQQQQQHSHTTSSSSSSSSSSKLTTSFIPPVVVAPVSTAPLPSDSPLRSYNGMSVWQASDFELRGSTGQSISSDIGSGSSFINQLGNASGGGGGGGGGGEGQLSPSFEFVPPSTASSAFPIRSSAVSVSVNNSNGSLTLVDDANRSLTSPNAPRQYVYNGAITTGTGPSSSSATAAAAASTTNIYDNLETAELIKLQTNKRLGLMTAGEASRFGLTSASSAASTADSTGGGDDMTMSAAVFSSTYDRSLLATASSTLSTGSAFGLDSITSKTQEGFGGGGGISSSLSELSSRGGGRREEEEGKERDSLQLIVDDSVNSSSVHINDGVESSHSVVSGDSEEVDDSLMKQLRLATAESQARLPSEEEMLGLAKTNKNNEDVLIKDGTTSTEESKENGSSTSNDNNETKEQV